MKPRLGEVLVKRGVVTQQQLDVAIRAQRDTGQSLGEILVAKGFATEAQIVQALALQLNIPFVNLEKTKFQAAAIDLVPLPLAKKHACIPVRVSDAFIVVAMHNPLDLMAMEELSFVSNRKVKQAIATRSDIARAIKKHYAAKASRDKNSGQLESTVMANATELDSADDEHRTLSIISNKGGVGKTHTSVNLAHCLAANGKRVLLVDADFGNADISNKLSIFPKATLLDVLSNAKRVEEVIAPTPFGFDLVAGKTGRVQLTNLTLEHKLRFIHAFNTAGQSYDIVMVDLGAGLSTQVLDFALATDKTIILTTPQDIIAGYACTKLSFIRFVELEQELTNKIDGYEPDRVYHPYIIVNQVSWPEQGETFFARIDRTAETNLNKKNTGFEVKPVYLGSVVYDETFHRKAEAGNAPYSMLFPQRIVTQCYTNLAKRLLGSSAEPLPEFRVKKRFRRFAEIVRQKF